MSLIITPPFRVSFVTQGRVHTLCQPAGYQDGPEKYGLTALWNVEDVKGRYKESWGKLIGELDAKAREFFDTPLAKLPANIRRGIRNGNEKEHLTGYGEGVLFASLSTDRKPQVVDLRKNLMTDEQIRSLVYPGCWCRASVGVFAYDNIGKGVALGLNNVQWLGHGERLDSVTDAKTDFADDPDDTWFQQEQDPETAADEGADEGIGDPEALDEDEIPF